MARSTTNWFILVSAVVAIVAVYYVYTLMFASQYFGFDNPEVLTDSTTLQHRCVWKQGDPVIYHLKTKLGVNYDAGHWFHMAENFMVQRSILREAKLLSNATQVFYSFDKGMLLNSLLVLVTFVYASLLFAHSTEGFISELNGITRLMVYQGTHCSMTGPETLYYCHLKALPWVQAHARVGSSVVLDHHLFDELQVRYILWARRRMCTECKCALFCLHYPVNAA